MRLCTLTDYTSETTNYRLNVPLTYNMLQLSLLKYFISAVYTVLIYKYCLSTNTL